jgi:Protein of unknown function (DUF2865)
MALLSSGLAATCAAYYIVEPMAHRTPTVAGDRPGLYANVQIERSQKKAIDRPVRLAEADPWLDSLRSESYWRRKSNENSETRRSATQRQSSSEKGSHNRTVTHRFSSASQSFSTGRTSYRSHQGSTYRTVCVRLCDGFFWPVSFATTSTNLKRDTETCQKSCELPVALYYYPNPGGEPEDMLDLDGQPYARLNTAFLYRTTYEPSCKCRPHPWEKEALERHKGYAESAAAEHANKKDAANEIAIDSKRVRSE